MRGDRGDAGVPEKSRKRRIAQLAVDRRPRASLGRGPACDLRNDLDALAAEAVRANIRTSVNHLRHGSAVLERLIESDGLMVVGAEYSLETGVVDFFDVPSGA